MADRAERDHARGAGKGDDRSFLEVKCAIRVWLPEDKKSIVSRVGDQGKSPFESNDLPAAASSGHWLEAGFMSQ